MPILQLVMFKLSRMAPNCTLLALLHGWLPLLLRRSQQSEAVLAATHHDKFGKRIVAGP